MNRRICFAVCLSGMLMLLLSCALGSSKEPTETQAETPSPSSSTAISATPTLEGPPPPSSDELIDAALARGEIDEETALTYKVFAQFSDARLPGMYQGGVGNLPDNHIVDILQAEFPKLSAETQALMAPFLIPPIYKGSWADPSFDSPAGPSAPPTPGREGAWETPFQNPLPCDEIDTERWDHKSAMHSPVRFWWLKERTGDAGLVERLILAMDDDIWPTLTGLMGHTPLPDGGAQCNGGSPDLDIYVSPDVATSCAPQSTPPGCRETPSFIIFKPSASDAILTHEFMHTIQWSYNTAVDCMYPGNYAWLAEATASWSQDYVYPGSNEEHDYVPFFYSGGSEGLPPNLELYSNENFHQYGAYLFFFYLTHHFSRPDLVKTVWDNTESMPSLEAVDQAIPGGFDDVWGDFAVKNVVEPPYDEYQVWDQLNQKPSGSSLKEGELSPNTYSGVKQIGHLSIYYEWYTFSSDSTLVTFFNGLTYQLDSEPVDAMMGILPIDDGTTQYKFTELPSEVTQGVKIQAYFRIEGDTEWQLEDWTDKPYVSFCRDATKERLKDLIIITSNSDQSAQVVASGTYGPRLEVSDFGCWRYGGEASMLFSGSGEGGYFHDEQVIPNVAFERTETHPNIPYPFLHFKIVEGTLDRTYTFESTEGDCSGSGESQVGLTDSSQYVFGNDLFILYGAIQGSSLRRYSGNANTNQPVVVSFQCENPVPPGSILPQPWFAVDLLGEVLEKVYTVEKGGEIKGSGDMLEGDEKAQMLFEWSLVPLRESESSSETGTEASEEEPATSPGTVSQPSPQPTASAHLEGVPDYPNITTTQQVTAGLVIFTTGDTLEQVVEFYQREFTSLGWIDQSAPPPPTSGAPRMLTFLKEKQLATIMINAQQGSTMVMIQVASQ